MHTQSIAGMAAVAASISNAYDRLMFCRTYARMHTAEETREFMRLTTALLPTAPKAGHRSPRPRAIA